MINIEAITQIKNPVDRAIYASGLAHLGQKDRTGTQPFIRHPRAVAEIVRAMGGNVDQITAAHLHDVIEDTDWSINDLLQMDFNLEVLDIVDHMTRTRHETYMEYIDRCMGCSTAVLVKFADVAHNVSRLHTLERKEAKGMRKRYMKALEIITQYL